MAITGIIFLLLLLISLGLFIFMLVKTARNWGGLHTTMLVFIFISTWVFIFVSAGVAKRRVGWIKVHDKLEKTVQDLQAEETKLRFGDLGTASSDQVALVPTLAQLNRLTADRGRVWRNATMQTPMQPPFRSNWPLQMFRLVLAMSLLEMLVAPLLQPILFQRNLSFTSLPKPPTKQPDAWFRKVIWVSTW